jgi:hypothetical protein
MFDRVKAHVGRHKVVYSVGGVIVVAGIAYYVGTRVGATRILSPSIVGDNNKLNQKIITLVNRQGPPSWKIYCIETGEELNSQRAMALVHKISESDLSQHLNGLHEHVNGKHYVRRGLAA